MKTLTQSRIKTSLLLALVTTSAYSGLSLAQDMAAATPIERMSYRDNYVHLVVKSKNYKLLGGSYETYDRKITDGQDPEGKNNPPHGYDVRGHDGAIGFSVGRKGSEDVANWFSSYVGPMNNTFGHNPDKLNFAFAGTLELSIQGNGMDPAKAVVLKDIFFAQGRSGTNNNWWFGGLNCKQFGAWSAVKCTSDNYKEMTFTFVRGRVGQKGFNAYDDVDLYINEEPH